MQIAAGELVGLFGLWLIAWRAAWWRVLGVDRRAGGGGEEGRASPTRLIAGVMCIFAGYHLIVWAMPRSVTSVQFERGYWWVWGLCAALAVGVSVVIDRFERRH